MSEKDYDLARSSRKLGKLYPILKDKYGNIIDGYHRENADPDWPVVTVDSVDTPVKLELARLAANFCRRQLTATELSNRLVYLRKSMTVDQIAEETGIDRATIYRHLPEDLIDKERSEAIKQGRANVALATSLMEIQKAANRVLAQPTAQCKHAGCLKMLRENEIHTVNGKPYCSAHVAEEKVAFENEQKRLARIEEEKKKKKTTPGMIEGYGDKLGHMQDKDPEVDRKLFARLSQNQELIAAGWRAEYHKKYIVSYVESDVSLINPDLGVELAAFFDGPPHEKKADRDERNRALAAKVNEGLEILPLPYKSPTDKAFDELESKVLEKARLMTEEGKKWESP